MSQEERDAHNAKRCKFLTVESLEKRRARARERFLATPWDKLGIDGRRKRVIEEQEGKCNKCGLSEWLGEPLVLEIDHKDGCSDNNSRRNLEGICPNCHSLTPTWRGRNKRAKKANGVSDEEIANAIVKMGNVRQALLFVGMAAKGGNYRRATRIKKELENGPITQLAE